MPLTEEEQVRIKENKTLLGKAIAVQQQFGYGSPEELAARKQFEDAEAELTKLILVRLQNLMTWNDDLKR